MLGVGSNMNYVGPDTSLLKRNLQQGDAAPMIAVTAVFPPAWEHTRVKGGHNQDLGLLSAAGLLDKIGWESNLLCPFGSQSLLLLFCLVFEFLLAAYRTVEIN